VKLIATGEDPFLAGPEGVLDDGVVLVRAQDEAKGRRIPHRAAVFIEPVHVELELAEILVNQRPDLEVDDDEALEDGVIENQIDVEMIPVERNAVLARDERETASQFEEKRLQIIEERGFEF
jgi:hypothetical protein